MEQSLLSCYKTLIREGEKLHGTVTLCCYQTLIRKGVFVLCLVYPMLTVSLDCPFLIAPSVFSNVYLFFVLCTQC